MPRSLSITNKVFLAIFIATIIYIYSTSPPSDLIRGIAQFIPALVIGLTLLANMHRTKALQRLALIANALVCLIVGATVTYSAKANAFGLGVFMLVLFSPFFANTYFLFRTRRAATLISN